jgi:hypothetical protein
MPAEEMQVNQDTNPSEGYCIKIEVLPGGFTVSDPLPIESKDEQYTDSDEETIPDLTSMLKNVMSVIQENPVSGGEKEAFESVDAAPAKEQAY